MQGGHGWVSELQNLNYAAGFKSVVGRFESWDKADISVGLAPSL